VRRKIRSIRLNVKYKKHDGDGQGQARAEYRPIRGLNQEYRK
jgi:hypothetical protein